MVTPAIYNVPTQLIDRPYFGEQRSRAGFSHGSIVFQTSIHQKADLRLCPGTMT
jgi:hypothetical protein